MRVPQREPLERPSPVKLFQPAGGYAEPARVNLWAKIALGYSYGADDKPRRPGEGTAVDFVGAQRLSILGAPLLSRGKEAWTELGL